MTILGRSQAARDIRGMTLPTSHGQASDRQVSITGGDAALAILKTAVACPPCARSGGPPGTLAVTDG